jgi:hypothetical protein
MRRTRQYIPEEPPGGPRPCDHSGCVHLGAYRAPRSRSSLRQYYYFCLDHVREYNAAWDYFRGMSATEIERLRRADVVGDRPSWPLGARAAGQSFDQEAFARAFRQFFDGEEPEPQPRRRPRSKREEALAVLELSEDCTFAQVKARYKELVKRHHPDANGGDKAAEERLKSINQAYSVLKVQAAQP